MLRQGLLLGCVLLAGCSSTGSKTPDAKPASRDAKDRGPAEAPFWANPDDRNSSNTSSNRGTRIPPAGLPTRSDTDGLIAGAVVDLDGRRVPDAFIQVTNLSGPKTAKPIGVHTDGQGYFSVPVRPGQGYELAVRVENTTRVLAGSMIVQAPDTQIVLKVSEDNVSSLTPAAPPPIGSNSPFAQQPPPAPRDNRAPAPSTWRETPLPADQPQDSKPRLPPLNTVRTENIADTLALNGPPTANIPGPNRTDRSLPPLPAPAPATVDPSVQPSTFKTVPKSAKLEFELTDLQGKSWKFGEHSGKLVLLDFWGTWCGPCLQSIPKVRQLARDYGASGLEVVGLACEKDGTWDQQANAVAKTAQRLEINYSLYLEPAGKPGSVQDKFAIKSYPTLILLDRDGTVLYRGHDFLQLERAIKSNIR